MSYQMQTMLSRDLHTDTFQTNWGFTFDECKQEISSPTGSMHLRSKLWQVLSLLVAGTNNLIKRDDLIEQVWQGNFLTGPQGLTHTICHLRRVIKKLDLPLNIITIPKRGYVLRVTSKETKPQPASRMPVISNSYFMSSMKKIAKSSALVPLALSE
jgi:DNA-binding winged helix-turn-helix (wHTH) protein